MMKRYKLLKDLPNLKKGTILSEGEPIFGVKTLITKNNDACTTFIDNELFENFFEEIKEPTDSIHWKPKNDEKIWYIDKDYSVNFTYFNVSSPYHRRLLKFGNSYRSLEECTRVRNRKLAEVRLRRTSTFKPDFENNNSGYVVYYDFRDNKLDICSTACCSYGERVHYKTKEEAEKSIKENEKEWLIYFGVKKD